jgi:membrane-associated phospholipid phosphatase
MADALPLPNMAPVQNVAIAEPRVSERVWIQTVRRSEWVVLGFLFYAAVVGCVLPVAMSVKERAVFVNLAVGLIYTILIRLDSARPRLWLSVTRDWLPLALILLAYQEMGWFALPQPGHPLESHWVVWDRWFLRGGGKAVIEALGPLVPSLLEIAYALVYTLAPFSVAALYLCGHRRDVDRFLLIFALGVLSCYVQFPWWPSEPPRVVFFGEDFPAYDTVFRRFNWWMLAGAGIHTSVFPSAHVAGAFSAALGMRHTMPERKWIYRMLIVIASLIAVATVYGRYHYLADATAGFWIACTAAIAAWAATSQRRVRMVSTPILEER